MFIDFLNWLLNVASDAGVAAAAIFGGGYFLRDTLTRYFTKGIENRFDEKLETFRANIRDGEKELEQIRSFLVSAKRERDSAFQTKRLEAAENLLRARDALSQFSMLVEYMKILNTEKILKDGNNEQIAEFASTLIKPFDIDQKLEKIKMKDHITSHLYLSERSLKAFDAYKSIIIDAIMMMKLFSIPLPNKENLINRGNLSKKLSEIIPNSKESFDKWGDEYAYHWATYFHDEILKSLRHEVSGADDLKRDAESIEHLALESRNAQINVRSTLAKAGLPETLINSDQAMPEKPPAVAG